MCGQDEQVSGMDQLYTGPGEDDTVQLSTTCSLTFTNTVWFCEDSNSGGPKIKLPDARFNKVFQTAEIILNQLDMYYIISYRQHSILL